MNTIKLQRIHTISVSRQSVQALLCLRIPHLDLVVIGSGHDKPTVVLHTTNGGNVSHQHMEAISRRNVPHSQCGVSRSRNNPAKMDFLELFYGRLFMFLPLSVQMHTSDSRSMAV